MAIVSMVHILQVDAAGRRALCHVQDIDTALLGKAMQRGAQEWVPIASSALQSVQTAFPNATVYEDAEAKVADVMELLVTAGLRVKNDDGSFSHSPLTLQIEEWGPIAEAMGEPIAEGA
jgi:hypothetical protein